MVSVIVPVYNIASYVQEAVESALAQTFSDLEVLVIDDGSTDDTVEALSGIQDARLNILRQPHRGLSATRNYGIQQARGTYLALLDGDDRWEITKIEHHVRFLEAHPDIDLSFALHVRIDSSGNPQGMKVNRDGRRLSFSELLVEPPAGNAVLRRRVLDQSGIFDSNLSTCEDIDLWLRISRVRPDNIALLPMVLDHKRCRDGQITGDWRRMQQGWQIIRKRACALDPDTFQKAAARADSAWLSYFAFIAGNQGEQTAALALILRSLRTHPISWLHYPRRTLLLAACLSGVVLPASLHRALVDGGLTIVKRWMPNC